MMKKEEVSKEFILNWCKEHNQVAWLKAECKKTQAYKRYPRVKGEDGKYHADKTQPPVVTEERVAFVTVKAAFIEKFGAEIGVESAKPKAPNFFDEVDAL